MVIVNGENASGRGIEPALADRMFAAGADVITLGNHAFANRKICGYLDEHRYIIRPLNMSCRFPGEGSCIFDTGSVRVCVINLIGRVNMDFAASCPFDAADAVLRQGGADIYIVDFHAQATSEKQALGYYLDGRVSAIFGTHTHVPTADGHVMKNGTGYITDVGMTGGMESVIGVRWQQSVSFFRGVLTSRFEPSAEDMCINGVVFDIGPHGTCRSVDRVEFR